MNAQALHKRLIKLTEQHKLFREDSIRIYDIYQTMLLQLRREYDQQTALIAELKKKIAKLERSK